MFKIQENRIGRFLKFCCDQKVSGQNKIGTHILKCSIIRYSYNMKSWDRKRTIRENVLWKL